MENPSLSFLHLLGLQLLLLFFFFFFFMPQFFPLFSLLSKCYQDQNGSAPKPCTPLKPAAKYLISHQMTILPFLAYPLLSKHQGYLSLFLPITILPFYHQNQLLSLVTNSHTSYQITSHQNLSRTKLQNPRITPRLHPRAGYRIPVVTLRLTSSLGPSRHVHQNNKTTPTWYKSQNIIITYQYSYAKHGQNYNYALLTRSGPSCILIYVVMHLR